MKIIQANAYVFTDIIGLSKRLYKATRLTNLGILIDFKILKGALNKVLDEFDHQYLNELEIFANQNPTAEIIAKEIFDKLSTAEIFSGTTKLKGVTVYESPKSSVTYFP